MPPPELLRLPYRPDSSPLYDALRGLGWPAWLDSGFPRSGSGRFDIITADPYATLVQDEGGLRLSGAELPPDVARPGEPLAILRALVGVRRPAPENLPFAGGAIGFLGYDLARTWGELPPRAGLHGWPGVAVGLYDWALVVDHARQRTSLVRQGLDPRGERSWRAVCDHLADVPERGLEAPAADDGLELLEAGMPFERYADAFERVQRYIRDGDCYQVNLAQRFRAWVGADGWSLYRRMRTHNPSPYGALLEYPFGEVLSFSPEQFLGLEGDRVQTRPIKGTRRRGSDAEQDLALRAELLASPKDRAENLMIVDLLRNDLGKVCVPGSIEVPGLFELESFATVHHLVSTVRGRLAPGCDAIDLLRACFPGGSITGAPKRRAMQIIDELEPVRREVYCGSIFRLGFDGGLDSSIAIRTLLKRGREAFYWAGGGIVADSDLQAEYAECLDKAAPFLRLFGGASERDPGRVSPAP